jgi:hypothetical protein
VVERRQRPVHGRNASRHRVVPQVAPSRSNGHHLALDSQDTQAPMTHLPVLKHRSVHATLVVLVTLVTACGSTEPRTSISVTGAVTFNGAPVAGGQVKILDSFGVTVAAADIANGRYSISAEITPATCNPTAITILARDASGTTIGLDSADLGRCGEHVVDFAF